MKRKSLLFLLLFALIAPWAANAQTLFSEGFEGGSMPTGWTTDGPGTWRVGSGDYSSSTGAGMGTYNALITHGNTDDVTKLITPEIDLSSVTSAMLSFMHVQRSWAGDIDELRVYYRTSSSEAWTQLVAYTSAVASWTTEEEIVLPNPSATYQLAFEYTDNYGYGVGLDQVVISVPAACPKPTLGQAEYISEEGASFQWTENGSATQWVLQYSTASDFSNPTEIERSGIPALAITGLSSSTTYYFRLKSVCGAGDESDWSNTVSFTTLCSAQGIPYTYDFEEETPFGCWTPITGVTRANSTSNAHESSYYLRFAGTTSNLVALPQFTPATNTLRVEFWTRPESATSSSCGKFAVGYMTDIADANSFVAVATYNYNDWSSATYVKKSVDLVGVPASANIAMRQFDCATYYYWYVDDVTVKEIPSCVAPTNLAADATTNSAELSWTANSGETDWTLYWKKSTDETYTEVANATNPYTLNGLDAASTYQYYVVANCSADEASEASEVFSFITECDVITVYPYTENFDSYATGVLPVCWSRINKSTNASYNGYPKISSSYAQSSPNSLYFSSYYTESSSTVDPQDQYAILPEMQNLSSMRIKLYARASSTSAYYDATFHVGVMTDPEDETTFTEVATYKPTTTSYTLYTIPFDTYTGNGTYIAIKMDAAAAIEDYTYAYHVVVFDDITVEEIPSCLEPTNLDVTANGQAATLTWVSEVGAYEIAHALEAAADPDENIVGTAIEATYTMNELALDKDHYFWVRANCGNSNSVWVGPVSVHIGYCLPAPTSVDNSGITNVTFGVGDNVVNNSTHPTAAPYYADYTSQVGAVQAAVEATIAITYATSYTYNTYVWVDLNNNLVFEADEVICYGESTSANPTTLTLNFTIPATVATGDYRMRIGGADSGLGSNPANANPCYSSTYGIFEDYTLRVLEAPDCMPVTGLTASNATAHTVDLAWTAGGDETAWVVAYKTADEEEFTEVPATTNPFTLSGLRAETTYSVKVAADCGDTQSTYTNEISITTEVACPAPTALTVSDVTPFAANVSWTGDAEGYTLRYRALGNDASGFNYGFEDAEPWTITDFSPCTVYDGDGGTTYGFNGWTFTNAYYVGACIAFNNDNEGGGNMVSHSGDAFGVMFSNGADEDDNPVQNNDWFILPELTIAEGDVFSFWGREITTQYGDETINVGIYGTTDGTFAEVLASNVAVNTQEYVKFEYDLSAYAGQTIKLAINYVSTDIFGFMFDDIFVGNPNAVTWDVTDNAAASPYPMTDLSAGTAYEVQVQANCGEDGYSEWITINFSTPSLCNSISTLPVDETTLTETSATLSWTGYSDSYNVRYRTAEDADILLFEDFSNGIGDWTTSNLNSNSGPNTSNAYFAFHWTTTPPQYLISPELEGVVDGTVLQFVYAAPSTSWTETFQVGYSSTGTDVDADFTWGDVIETVNNTGAYYTEQVPAGTKYFAIKCTSNDQYYLYVTNFLVYANYVAAGEWQYVNNVTTTSTTLNDLEPGTWYEWQVQGADCGDNWIDGEDFQTLTEGVVQETALIAGWNWFSTYIQVDDPVAMLQAVEASLGENGIMIKNSDVYTENDADWGWYGDLDEVGIVNEQMYKIQVSGPCTVTLDGTPANPADHSITINPGWNWIGFPCSVTMSVDDAFAGFAKDGDKIRNSDGETPYDADWEMWLGDIETLEPGQGYMYYSSSSEQRTLVFPTGAKTRSVANFGSLTKKQFKITVTDNSKSTDNNLMTKKAFKK